MKKIKRDTSKEKIEKRQSKIIEEIDLLRKEKLIPNLLNKITKSS